MNQAWWGGKGEPQQAAAGAAHGGLKWVNVLSCPVLLRRKGCQELLFNLGSFLECHN